jgi:hypothetical protein
MYENGIPVCLACATDIAAKIAPAERATAYGTMDGTGSALPKDFKRSVS